MRYRAPTPSIIDYYFVTEKEKNWNQVRIEEIPGMALRHSRSEYFFQNSDHEFLDERILPPSPCVFEGGGGLGDVRKDAVTVASDQSCKDLAAMH